MLGREELRGGGGPLMQDTEPGGPVWKSAIEWDERFRRVIPGHVRNVEMTQEILCSSEESINLLKRARQLTGTEC